MMRQRGEHVQKAQRRVILPLIAEREIDVGYEQHDMAAQHTDVGGKVGLFLRILHLGKDVKRGFLDGIDKLAEFGIIAFQVRMTGHARAWRDEVSVHLATVPVLTQAADQQEVSS